MNRAPAFMYYPKDHIATLAALTMEERGAWVTLANHCWWEGPLTIDIATRLVGEKLLQSVRFLMRGRGNTVTFDWIEDARKKQAARSEVNAQNGAMGGRGNRRGRKAKSERFAIVKRTNTEIKPSRAGNANAKGIDTRGKVPAPAMPFQSVKAQVAWHRFLEMRRSIGKPLDPGGPSLIISETLEAMGEDAAIASLNKSTVSRWPDVYPVKTSPKANGAPKAQANGTAKAHTGQL